MGESRGTCMVLKEKSEGRRPLGRRRRRWEDNIKMNPGEVGWGHRLDRSVSRKRQVTGCCECGNKHSTFIQYGKFFY
jgi:hypothetical protein